MKFEKKDIFTIPNILTYLRLLALPFFIWMMIASIVNKATDTRGIYHFVAFIIFILAEITDIVDGYIARKYNMVTDIGKIIDPIADKLLQGFTILLLAIAVNTWFVWIFAGILIFKEIYMGGVLKYFMKKSKRQVEQKANKVGKAGAAMNFAGLILTFGLYVPNFLGLFDFPEILLGKGGIAYYVDMVYLFVCCFVQIYAATQYTIIYNNQLTKLRESGILDTLDDQGNPISKEENN